MRRTDLSHFTGCIIGGAVGDALGAPIEFMSLGEIRHRFGPHGVSSYVDLGAGGDAEFTDDTQMTLFTAEGVIIAREYGRWDTTEAVYRAYLRWLRTQRMRRTGPTSELTREGWLMGYEALWKSKAPGHTCLSALASSRVGSPERPLNDSKGCGGVMRVAPIGLAFPSDSSFDMAMRAAALTHGHPTGYLTAGLLAYIIAEIIDGSDLIDSIESGLSVLKSYPHHEETLTAVQNAIEKAQDKTITPTAEMAESLGAGWVAEEALAISLYCALVFPEDFASAVLLAINHSGDSDSTGAITGNVLGALLGINAVPLEWREHIELYAEMEAIAARLLVEKEA